MTHYSQTLELTSKEITRMAAILGLVDLLAAGKRGYRIQGIDERKIKLDSPHKASILLQDHQSPAKKWLLLSNKNLFCCSQLAFIHDELQYECDPSHAEDLCSI